MSELGKGYQVVASDIAITTAGTPVAVYGVNITSDGTAGAVLLRNGSTVSGTLIMTLLGTASKTVHVNFGGVGVVFPDGCFVDVDAHVTPSCTVIYERV